MSNVATRSAHSKHINESLVPKYRRSSFEEFTIRMPLTDAGNTTFATESAGVHQIPSNVIRPLGYNTMECGYCKGQRAMTMNPPKSSTECSKSFGLLVDALTPELYEKLICRGWRRSGIHLYKPSNFECCCPTISIRLLVDQFVPTKSQSKLLRKLDNLMLLKAMHRNKRRPDGSPQENISKDITSFDFQNVIRQSGILQVLQNITDTTLLESNFVSQGIQEILNTIKNHTNTTYKIRLPSKQEAKLRQVTLHSSICAQISGKLKISKDALLHLVVEALNKALLSNSSSANTHSLTIISIQAHSKSGQILVTLQLPNVDEGTTARSPVDKDDDVCMSNDTTPDNERDCEDKLGEWYRTTIGKKLLPNQRKLTIETMPAHESALNPQVHELYIQYQHIVHQDPDPLKAVNEPKLNTDTKETQDTPAEGDGSSPGKQGYSNISQWNAAKAIAALNWGIHPPKLFTSNVQRMLLNYLSPHPPAVQSALLNNYFSFYQFLVESPFDYLLDQPKQDRQNNPAHNSAGNKKVYPCGTYHQHYRVGDALIAVGVVDVLPTGLSSVYLYYHPEFSHSLVALGKLAILKEIEFTHTTLGLPYYYLGYYIESCRKMRYKAEYHPSQLLCPVSYQWVDCSVAIPKLQSVPQHVCMLVDDDEEEQEVETQENDTEPTSSTSNPKRLKTRPLEDVLLSRIPMDIGAQMTVTLDMLQENGQQVVRPILQELSEEVGHELLCRMVVKLV